MKKIVSIFIIALCFATIIKAQDTTWHPIKVWSYVDTVKGAILVQPISVNALTRDSAYQCTWSAFGVTNDSTQGCNTYVQLFDHSGKKVLEFNCPIPAAIKNQWGFDDNIITNYIFLTFGITKK